MQRRLFSRLALGVILGLHSVFPRYLYSIPAEGPQPDANPPREESTYDTHIRNYLSWREYTKRLCLYDQDPLLLTALEGRAGVYMNADYTQAVQIGELPPTDSRWYRLDGPKGMIALSRSEVRMEDL